ncbi:hypothetical protein AVEN_220860-1 [Araneus ventricosus]|uniref:Uncharacterized protein n=1 Tax=Araneus ventricosus TaxID=182803 RepID=A0A4Y2DYK6_ARAVE|nr:hypothetical protein AVEN_220860-1 [Araneus ventricosus]
MIVVATLIGTEGRVLIAINSHTLPAGEMFRHRSGSNSAPHYDYAHQGSENPLTLPEDSHPRLVLILCRAQCVHTSCPKRPSTRFKNRPGIQK